MKTRIISALVALPLLFFVLIKGGTYLLVATVLLSLIGLHEYLKIFTDQKVARKLPMVTTLLWFAGLYMNWGEAYFTFLITFLVLFLMGMTVFDRLSLTGVALTLLGFFYVVFSLAHIVKIDRVGDNFFLWYPFIIAFVSDTFAYFTGKLIGKTPLIKKVSPNKTVEGSIGGVVFATLASGIYAYILNPDFLVYAILLGCFGSMLSQMGDLMASKIKRVYHIKDFGTIMPGHGGVLDRFDSIIVTMPLVYYTMLLYMTFTA